MAMLRSMAILAVAAEVVWVHPAAASEAAGDLGDVSPAHLAADDACPAGDPECGLSLRQLRGEQLAAEEEEEEVAKGAEEVVEVGEVGDALFSSVDADGDGQVRLDEVTPLLLRLGGDSAEAMSERHAKEDSDRSGGLDAGEFAAAMEKWATSCSAAHASSFCRGITMVKCCHRGRGWHECGGSVSHHRSCGRGGGGGYAGASYHSGGYHSGGGGHSGGGYHSGGGGYSGGGYHSGGGGYHSGGGGYHSGGGGYASVHHGSASYHSGGYHSGHHGSATVVHAGGASVHHGGASVHYGSASWHHYGR